MARGFAITWFVLLATVLTVPTCPGQPSPSTAPSAEKSVREGEVVHLLGSPATVYLLKGGRKSLILDPNWVLRNGYQWEDVRAFSRADLDAIPSGADILEEESVPVNHQLVRSARDGKVYVVADGEKRWLLNPDWVAANGYRWEDLRTVSGRDLDLLPTGESIASAITMMQESKARTHLVAEALLLSLIGIGLLWALAAERKHLLSSVGGPILTALGSRLLWLALFALLLILRMPSLFTHPRFWAEEGTVWFQYALDHSALKTLMYTFPDSGYLNLLPNIGAVGAALVARAGHVEHAPLATTLLAAAVQLICFVVILFGGSQLFAPLWRAICGCCVVLFAPVETREIWLNTINSMSYLGLLAVLLLFCEPGAWSRPLKWASRSLLVLCGLSGPYSVFLLPAFVFYRWRHQSRERTIQVFLLSVCLAAQGGLVIANRLTGQLPAARISHFSAATAAINVLHLQIVAPILGGPMATAAGKLLGLMGAWDYSGAFPRRPGQDISLAGIVSFMMVIGALLYLSKRDGTDHAQCLALIFVLVAAGTAVGSLYSIPGGRYAFLPTTIFLFLVGTNLDTVSKARFFIVSAGMCLYLSNGLLRFRDFGELSQMPQWADEVRLWRHDHRHLLRVWPAFWTSTVDLRSIVKGPGEVSGPSPVFVRPSSGAGSGATSCLTAGAPGCFKHVSDVHFLVNSEAEGPRSCRIYYRAFDDSFGLVNDGRTATLGALRSWGTGNDRGHSMRTVDGWLLGRRQR